MKYICDPHIVPSVVPTDLSAIAAAAARSRYAGALHVDIADGVFAHDATWPQTALNAAEIEPVVMANPAIKLTAHLMVSAPFELGVALARAGVYGIVGHIEAFASPADASRALAAWKDAGAREVGLSLKIDTPLALLDGVVGYDMIQLMSIAVIGHQGEPFDDTALSRVEEFHAEHPEVLVAVDGGVSEANIEDLVRAGANRFVVGHVLSESSDPEKTFSGMLERAMRGCAPTAPGVTV